MGTALQISCNQCGYGDGFTLGLELADWSLTKALDRVQSDIRDQITGILNQAAVIDASYEHRLYRCTHCDQLYERLYVKLLYEDPAGRSSKIYEAAYRCPHCRQELQPLKNISAIRSLPCPRCKCISLKTQEDHCRD